MPSIKTALVKALAAGPGTGPQLVKRVRSLYPRLTKDGEGTIYPALYTLCHGKKANRTASPEDDTRLKVYSLSDVGALP